MVVCAPYKQFRMIITQYTALPMKSYNANTYNVWRELIVIIQQIN